MTIPKTRIAMILALTLALIGCGTAELPTESSQVEEASFVEIPSPARTGAGEPNLSIRSDGSALLSWIEPGDEGHLLRLASLQLGADGWSEPETVSTGDNWFVNWADFPSVVPLAGGGLAAHWLAKTGPGTYAYEVRIALSGGLGQQWGESIVPHGDGTETEHGFVSLLPMSDGSMSAVWLDGRQMGGPDGGDMSLRHAFIGADGSVGAETLLDDRVCECCQTSAAAIPGGLLAVYRNRTEGEVRDISLVRYHDGVWSEPRDLSEDGWQINGCPVNGPSISASGSRVAVAWFTAAGDEPAVWLKLSDDAGETFGIPVRIDDGGPLGRIEAVRVGRMTYVIWLEQIESGAEIRIREVRDDGTFSRSWQVTDTKESRSSGFPQIAADRNRLIVAWTDADEPSTIRTAILRLGGNASD